MRRGWLARVIERTREVGLDEDAVPALLAQAQPSPRASVDARRVRS